MHQSYSWKLGPGHEHLLGTMEDEFVTGKFRLRLRGSTLTVEAQAAEGQSLQAEARQLAERYVKLLAPHLPAALRLMTAEEFRALPSIGMVSVRGLSREEGKRIGRAIQKARHELVQDPTLKRCYDYFEAARQSEGGNVLYNLSKLVEAVEYTGTSKELKVRSEVEFVTKLANQEFRDERHPPRPGQVVEPPTAGERARAMECAKKVLRAYEERCTGVQPEESDKEV